MSCPSAGSQGNSLSPGQVAQQPGSPELPGQPYQSCWPCQPNQAYWPGMQPNVAYWPVNQPAPAIQPGWPSFQPTQPSQSNQPMPAGQPFQSNQPMPASQPFQPMPPNHSNQPNQPLPPIQPLSPIQPNQPNWPSQAPSVPRPTWYGNPGQSGWPGQSPTSNQQQPWPPVPSTRPVSVPFNMNFPRGIYDKLMLTIKGQVKPDAKMFTVNFLRGNDIALHINPRFNEGGKQVLVRNHKLGEQWGPEERNLQGPFPFAAGQPFEMKILCTTSEFKVAVNNKPLFEFKHRIKEVNQIDRINILHDVSLTSVNVDTLS